MAANIIDGEAIAAEIRDGLKKDVEALGKPVKLVAVIATDNKGARMYAGKQEETCAEVGIQYELAELPADSDEAAIVTRIEELNAEDIEGLGDVF